MHGTGKNEECFICFDREASCVFMECGHAGVCRPCANKLWARPPHQCPTCRERIQLVVELVPSPVKSPGSARTPEQVFSCRRSFEGGTSGESSHRPRRSSQGKLTGLSREGRLTEENAPAVEQEQFTVERARELRDLEATLRRIAPMTDLNNPHDYPLADLEAALVTIENLRIPEGFQLDFEMPGMVPWDGRPFV
mmetsp:Transcript_5459/g.18466  ORF Transcript_5459/g.18466 Transcript_5459/m.18466 type:complete len:195 (-) Transcript_5459:301-885(-)